MTRYPGYGDANLDPEVHADLRLRDSSEGDRTRTRTVAYAPPVFVEHWPCKGCSVMVGITREVLDTHAMFNRQLVKRRESPLPKRAQCDDCKRRDEDMARMEREAKEAARRPHEQREMPLDNPNRRRHP
jgi:hypothetical protein